MDFLLYILWHILIIMLWIIIGLLSKKQWILLKQNVNLDNPIQIPRQK